MTSNKDDQLSSLSADAIQKNNAVVCSRGLHPRMSGLNPDMPTQELLLHMGELKPAEILVARAAISWANSKTDRAVKLAEKLLGEPSEGMIQAGAAELENGFKVSWGEVANSTMKAMIAQALKEVNNFERR